MPASCKLIIDLPTGEGKSAVFRVVDRVGFASDPVGARAGTTLVIVPTVTLAFDHERTCGGTKDRPLAYIGGRDDQNVVIRSAIEAGTQGLCFAAPEAALGPLKNALSNAARMGQLRAVIVDEAHLVEAWGTGFRTAFQTLAAQCRQWLDAAPPQAGFRTIFLSATISESARQTLIDLFEPDGDIPMVSGAKVRPEPDYWVSAPCDSATRSARVREALRYLPRPAILYVTRVADARNFYEHLKAAGYGRIAVVHGQTPNTDRESVLRRWAAGQIDLVVATSAFGLGVDYPHVRTVVHACLPETFDRFYQEVGRAGRDGCSTISLLLPAFDDARLAESLNRQTVISVERGFQRWRAMFGHPDVVALGHPRYRIRLDVAPGHSESDIDLIGERSTDWNARLLVLMARSGLIRVLGPASAPSGEARDTGPWFDIEVANDGHLDVHTWTEKTEPKRQAIGRGAAASLALMRRFLAANECPGMLAAELYSGIGRTVALHCSGCAVCRADPARRRPEGIVGEKPPPWPITARLAPALTSLLGPRNVLVVEMPNDTPDASLRRDVADAMKRLDRFGLRMYAAIGSTPQWFDQIVRASIKNRPWVVVESPGYSPYSWPKGPRVACFGSNTPVELHWFEDAPPSSALIALVPVGATLPDQPHRKLVDVIPGPAFGLWDLIERLLV
jgi:hypothetical protein